ncbi:MAG: tetratricopeptide repeat protein [candidate division KSB1 bacterium]|nr:tetratricopeptide repeat protein [candidate division KSB1 bacterium]
MPGIFFEEQDIETIEVQGNVKKNIIILSFNNQTGDAELDWLEKGIMEMLISDLSQSRQLDVSLSSQAESALRSLNGETGVDSAVGLKIARQLNAEMYIFGSFKFVKDSLLCQVKLLNAKNGRLLQTIRENSAKLEHVLLMVDRISKQLRIGLEVNAQDMPGSDRRLVDVTTSSIEAYEQYTLGIKERERLNHAAARRHFKRAVELDTTFASAYLQLAELGFETNDMRSSPIDKAIEYIEKTTERESLYIRAHYNLNRGNFIKAISIYEELTHLYPKDVRAHYELGSYYFGVGRDYDKAIRSYERAIQINPNHKLAHNQLAYSYAAIGELKKAYNVLETYIDLAPKDANPYDSYGEVLWRQGEIEPAVEQFKIALEKNPDFFPAVDHLIRAYVDLNKTNKAERILNQYVDKFDDDGYQQKLMFNRALIKVSEQDVEGAVKYLETLVDQNDQNLQPLIALYYLDPHNPKLFEQLDNEIRKLEKRLKNFQDFQRLFQSVYLGLLLQSHYEPLALLMQQFVEQQKDDYLLLPASYYHWVLKVLNRQKPQDSGKMSESMPDQMSFNYSNSVQWDDFWQFYFKALPVAFERDYVKRSFFKDWQKHSAEQNFSEFYFITGVALGVWEKQLGKHQQYRKELQRVGAPLESDWRVIGPFRITMGLHQTFWPENNPIEEWIAKADAKGTLEKHEDSILDGFVNLKESTEAPVNSCAYALLNIKSKAFKKTFMRFGTNGTLKVWLNDRFVMTKNIRDQASPDQYIVPVTLREGDNWLLVRVQALAKEYGFYFRITDNNGLYDPDVEYGSEN